MSRAIVIGGASGIGLATVDAFVEQGVQVIVADRDTERADQVAAARDGVAAVHLDVTDEASVAATFADAGEFDTVVNCAGLSNPGALTELELDAWRNTVDTCLTGTFLVIKHAGRRIADGGSIICVASLNGRQPGAGMGAYCASKAGVLMLVEVAALELADRRVRVNAVSPGLVMTPLTEGIGFVPGLTEDYLDNTPLGRSGEPAEIADTIAFLASDKARWITGAAFDVNGGAHLKRYPDVLGKVRALAGEG